MTQPSSQRPSRPTVAPAPPLYLSDDGNCDAAPAAEAVDLYASPCRCSSPWCPHCGRRSSAREARDLLAVVDGFNWSTTTLTVAPHNFESPLHAWLAIGERRAIALFLRSLNRPKGRREHLTALVERFRGRRSPRISAAIRRLQDPRRIRFHRTLEFQSGARGRGDAATRFPHWHLLVSLPLIWQPYASEVWRRLSGGAGCWCQPVVTPARAVRYLTKPPTLPTWALAVPSKSLKRFSVSRGFWRGVRFRPQQTVRRKRQPPRLRPPLLRRVVPFSPDYGIEYLAGPGRRLGDVLAGCLTSTWIRTSGAVQRKERIRLDWETARYLLRQLGAASPWPTSSQLRLFGIPKEAYQRVRDVLADAATAAVLDPSNVEGTRLRAALEDFGLSFLLASPKQLIQALDDLILPRHEGTIIPWFMNPLATPAEPG